MHRASMNTGHGTPPSINLLQKKKKLGDGATCLGCINHEIQMVKFNGKF